MNERPSQYFVIATVVIFVGILLYGLVGGRGGFLTQKPTPTPIAVRAPRQPSSSAAPSTSAGASGSPAASAPASAAPASGPIGGAVRGPVGGALGAPSRHPRLLRRPHHRRASPRHPEQRLIGGPPCGVSSPA